MSAVSLGHLNAPCILYNLDGYYNDLKALLEHMIDKAYRACSANREFILPTTCKRSHRSSTARQRLACARHPIVPFAAQMVGAFRPRPLYNKTYFCRL